MGEIAFAPSLNHGAVMAAVKLSCIYSILVSATFGANFCKSFINQFINSSVMWQHLNLLQLSLAPASSLCDTVAHLM